ncbi:MAG TPA: hypothetical protein VGL38_08515 [bacterium]|jgi:hypothetical protein
MHTLIKYLGAGIFLALAGLLIFNGVFAGRPVGMSRTAAAILATILLAIFVYWLWYGRPNLGMLWPEM